MPMIPSASGWKLALIMVSANEKFFPKVGMKTTALTQRILAIWIQIMSGTTRWTVSMGNILF